MVFYFLQSSISPSMQDTGAAEGSSLHSEPLQTSLFVMCGNEI